MPVPGAGKVSVNGSERALRIALVGSGPAGFYAASALFGADVPIEVDMFERLPTPWGLVRLGVAPDHPKLKTVSRAFERIAELPGFRFLGNVEIGRDRPLDRGHRELADSRDRRRRAARAGAGRVHHA